MNFHEYQRKAWEFAIYPNRNFNPEYPALGLAGEAGEVCNKIKKIQRDNLDMDTVRDSIASEIADTLWYISALCSEFGLDLDVIAQTNLMKLESRRARGVIGGSGDSR
jgi:NTP pyrophosphatase (non-canonical NTP hydrolase)